MTRIITGLLAIALLCAAGCSGSNGTTPDKPAGGDTGNGNAEQTVYKFDAPDAILGDHSVSVIPGKLSVYGGGTREQMDFIAAKFGYSLEAYRFGRAILRLPESADLASAARDLEKEFLITKAEPLQRINTARAVYPAASLSKGASFTPGDPYYGERFVGLGDDGTNLIFSLFPGQAQPMNMMVFNGAWDIALVATVAAEPVSVAIIDAGWFDYSTLDRPAFDETILDAANSGFMASNGTFTAGLAAATWDIPDDGDPATSDGPYRDTGEVMLGILAADLNTYLPWDIVDFDTPADGIQPDEIWNEGIAGINPNASYMLIKTGEVSGNAWTFPDTSIENSIDQAVAGGADIVLLGMFGNGPVSAGISTAIQNARDNNVLVIAPAGDVVDTYDGGTNTFTGTPVAINASNTTPGGDANCVSVTATGFNRIGALGQVNSVDNGGTGWYPLYGDPVPDPFTQVTTYCNTNATIAAVGYGIGFSFHPYITSGDGTAGNPRVIFPAENYNFRLSALGTSVAAAYVAGAASQVFQIMSNVNAAPPTDDEVLAVLLGSTQFQGMAGVFGTDGTDGGLLNAGLAAASAVNGGSIVDTLPALQFTQVQFSQALGAVTRGQDLTITPTIANGTAPFDLEVNWGDGNSPQTVTGWANNDPVTLTGGFDTLGVKGITITVTDSNNLTASIGVTVSVINPLGANISITNASGNVVAPTAVVLATNYRFSANATNVYTGEIGGTPNTTTFQWDMDGAAGFEANGPNPTFAYTGVGSFTITLHVEEAVRPDSDFTLNVTVIPPS